MCVSVIICLETRDMDCHNFNSPRVSNWWSVNLTEIISSMQSLSLLLWALLSIAIIWPIYRFAVAVCPPLYHRLRILTFILTKLDISVPLCCFLSWSTLYFIYWIVFNFLFKSNVVLCKYISLFRYMHTHNTHRVQIEKI